MRRAILGLVVLTLIMTGWSVLARPTPAAAATPAVRVEVLFSSGNNVWDVAFAPDGTMLFNQAAGRIHIRTTAGVTRELSLRDGAGAYAGTMTMMGMVLDPGFASNRTLYTCQKLTVNGVSDVRVVRWSINAGYTTATRSGNPVVSGIPPQNGHNGCRLRFDAGGYLFVAMGDGQVGTNPQDLSTLAGKTLRVTTAGAPAPGNPFIGSPNANTRLIYTLGHRNPQGLALRANGQMWEAEHGTDRDDEINLLRSGGNYGWNPLPGTYNQATPMTNPNVAGAIPAAYSTGPPPSRALSGITFLTGTQWGSANGSLIAAALAGTALFMFPVNGDAVGAAQAFPELEPYGRLRTPQMGPDGALYVTTSNYSQDKVLRVTPTAAAQCTGNFATLPGAAVVRTTADTFAFVRGVDGGAWYRSTAVSGPWVSLGGVMLNAPTVISWGGDRIDLFVRGMDSALYQRAYASGVWSPWRSLGGTLSSAPAATSQSLGTLKVFARGSDSRMFSISWDGQRWTPWADHGGTLTSAPAGAADPDSRAATVGALGPAGQLYDVAVAPNGAVGGFVARGLYPCSAPAYAAQAGDGVSFTMAYRAAAGNAVVGNTSIGGVLTGSPGLLVSGSAATVVVRGTDGGLWLYTGVPGSGTWRSLGGTIA